MRRFEPMVADHGRPTTPLAGFAVEPKFDGWRAMVDVSGGPPRVTSRTATTSPTESRPSNDSLDGLSSSTASS